jgi:tetratricopeptide (TPR) repeat protein
MDDPQKMSAFERDIRQSRFEELEPLLVSYVHERPGSSWGWYALGYCQFARKKVGESIQSLSKSLSLNVENGEAHKILGRDLMVIGRLDAAETEFEQAIRYSAGSAENYYDLGKLYSIRDNWEQARKQFETAIHLNGSYVEAINALGFAREALGDDAEAVKTYEKAIALNEQQHGTFVEPDVNLSAYYNRTGDAQKALDYADRALELDSKCDPAWFQKAKAQQAQGHLEDAVSSLNRATAINPRSSTYFYVLAGVYRRLGKLDESRKALDAFTKLDQENNELERMRRQARSADAAQSHAAHD